MTATCTLCGESISAELDNIFDSMREDRMFSRLGATFQNHMLNKHAGEPQRAIPDESCKAGLGQFLGLAPAGRLGVGIVAITAQGSALLSYLESSDPVFNKKMGLMREIVQKAIEQKKSQPVTSSPLVVG